MKKEPEKSEKLCKNEIAEQSIIKLYFSKINNSEKKNNIEQRYLLENYIEKQSNTYGILDLQITKEIKRKATMRGLKSIFDQNLFINNVQSINPGLSILMEAMRKMFNNCIKISNDNIRKDYCNIGNDLRYAIKMYDEEKKENEDIEIKKAL